MEQGRTSFPPIPKFHGDMPICLALQNIGEYDYNQYDLICTALLQIAMHAGSWSQAVRLGNLLGRIAQVRKSHAAFWEYPEVERWPDFYVESILELEQFGMLRVERYGEFGVLSVQMLPAFVHGYRLELIWPEEGETV